MSQTAHIQLSQFDVNKIDVDKTLIEIEEVKKQIEIVRREVSNFLSLLAHVSDNANEQEFFHSVAAKLFELRQKLTDYLKRYNDLLPFIELSHQASGFKAQKFELANLKPFINDSSFNSNSNSGKNTVFNNNNNNNNNKNNYNNTGSSGRPSSQAPVVKNKKSYNRTNNSNTNNSNNNNNRNNNSGGGLVMNGSTPSQSIML